MKRKTRKPPDKVRPIKRRSYCPPRIVEEQVFERQALQSCGKVTGPLCTTHGGTKSS